MKYIRHISLTSGLVSDCHREDVGEDALAVCSELITLTLTGEPVSVPLIGAPYQMSGKMFGRCLLINIASAWTDHVATIGIAAHSRCGSTLWRNLHELSKTPVTRLSNCPVEPWVATDIDTSTPIDTAEWLEQIAKCLAWAWVTRKTT